MKSIIRVTSIIAVLLAPIAKAEFTPLELQVDKPTKSMQKKLNKNKLSADSQCTFEISELVDERQNKKSLGYKGSTLTSGELRDWLENTKAQYFTDVLREKASIKISVKPSLTRLYTYPQSMNIHGVSAMVVDFEVSGEPLLKKHYRGFYAKTNWANGDGEYGSALNYAINDVLTSIASDLENVCSEVASKV